MRRAVTPAVKQVFMVSVTHVLPWVGNNPDDAANNAAQVLGHITQETADFYGPSLMLWGGVEEIEQKAG